jgi:hypothetical protein
LWSSFISLVRSYTAAHGLNGTRQAVLEVSADHLLVRAGERLLTVRFDGQRGTIVRDMGTGESSDVAEFKLDEQGRLVFKRSGTGESDTEEMDMVAERLAREIMR